MRTLAVPLALAVTLAALGPGCSDPPGPTIASPAEADREGGAELDAAVNEEPSDDASPGDARSRPAPDVSAPPSDAAADAGPADVSPPEAGARDAGGCTAVPVAVITPVAKKAVAPSLTGGTLTDGRYELVESVRYYSTGTSNTSFPAVGGGLEIVGSRLILTMTGLGVGKSYHYTVASKGSTLTLTRSCPTEGIESWGYQASGDTLVFTGMPPNGGDWVRTFVRRP